MRQLLSSMRDVHTVIEERGNHTFVVRNAYSGDVKEVRVDPDKIALFEDASSIVEPPDACPFLRFETPGGFLLLRSMGTLHLTGRRERHGTRST